MKKYNLWIPILLGIAVTLMCIAFNRIFVQAEEQSNPYGEPFTETITGYCACDICCGIWSDGITYSGQAVRVGICASSNPAYYGKAIIIYDSDGQFYGIYECLDKGPDYIDIYFEEHEEAMEFGKHTDWKIQVVEAKG